MATPSTLGLRDSYLSSLAAIQREFSRSGSGRAALFERTEVVDAIVLRLWQEFVSSDANDCALVAIGGYGRRLLFPYSDIDVLFLYRQEPDKNVGERVKAFSQALWDLKLRLSPQSRTLAQCGHFDANNLEFTIAALDSRYLAGNRELFSRLHESLVPQLVTREAPQIVHALGAATQARHAKFGNTIFHLEPNVKEGPGGLRDYNIVHWLALISAMEKRREEPEAESWVIAPSLRAQFDKALDYVFAVRCFLHFRHGRDDNTLTWEVQAEAAAQAIGCEGKNPLPPEEWMRTYFRHARAIHRVATQLLEEIPAARSSLYREFQNWRSRLSNSNFSVVNGFILLQQPAALKDPELVLRMFGFMAQHGLKLSRITEQRLEQISPHLALHPPNGATVWQHLRDILAAPHAADALRAMHFLGILSVFVPELQAIDSLVVRDYYHRFTVDEHSFLAIDMLHRQAKSESPWQQRYGELFAELREPELLLLALLLHDVGKGSAHLDHAQASVEAARRCMVRMDISDYARDTVCFLIANHLEMSKALRRDIFAGETIRAFAERVHTPERLKLLTLMTYADIGSVNPEALTPWKAENLWQLYIATSNHLTHSLDAQRVHTHLADDNFTRLCSLVSARDEEIKCFLQGLPQRYLTMYSAETVLRHLQLARNLDHDPVQLDLQPRQHCFELTLITHDTQGLFSKVSGVLAAWGMNIVKANAFSNQAGVVVDTFYFTDRFGTLELNPPERERFQRSLRAILCGEMDLQGLMRDRFRAGRVKPPKVKVATRLQCSNDFSPHCTVLEVVAQDRPRLLHDLTAVVAEHKYNIEIALIDTEGQVAVDVLYLTCEGAKLTQAQQNSLVEALLERWDETSG